MKGSKEQAYVIGQTQLFGGLGCGFSAKTPCQKTAYNQDKIESPADGNHNWVIKETSHIFRPREQSDGKRLRGNNVSGTIHHNLTNSITFPSLFPKVAFKTCQIHWQAEVKDKTDLTV